MYRIIRAHFYTPFGVVRIVRFCTAPKPPLCKGRCHGASRDGGIAAAGSCVFALTFGKSVLLYRTIPQSASLTAPFTQGSLSQTGTYCKKPTCDRNHRSV